MGADSKPSMSPSAYRGLFTRQRSHLGLGPAWETKYSACRPEPAACAGGVAAGADISECGSAKSGSRINTRRVRGGVTEGMAGFGG